MQLLKTAYLLSTITNLRMNISIWLKNHVYILSETMYEYLQQHCLEHRKTSFLQIILAHFLKIKHSEAQSKKI